MRRSDTVLIPVCGSSQADLIAGLETVYKAVQQGTSLAEVAWQAFQRTQSKPYSTMAVFLAHTPAEALRELEFGMRGIPGAIQKGGEWQTPAGSYYTSNPLGPDSRVSFVYPGAFNSYIGVGKDLFYTFPGAYDYLQEIVQDVSAILCEEQLYPRSIQPLDKAQLEQAESNLLNDANAMMVSGSGLSVSLTHIFRDVFQVEPVQCFWLQSG